MSKFMQFSCGTFNLNCNNFLTQLILSYSHNDQNSTAKYNYYPLAKINKKYLTLSMN